MIGAALKAPLVPFHAWFAAVVAEGPLCVGNVLVGPGLRVGLYLLARFIGPLCGELGGIADLIVGLAILGAFLQGLLTYGQANLKKMIACIGLLQGSLAGAGFFSLRPENAGGPVDAAAGQWRGGVHDSLRAQFPRTALWGRRADERRRDCAQTAQSGRSLVDRHTVLRGDAGAVWLPVGCSPRSGAVFSGEWTLALLAIGACLIGAWALFSMLQHLVFGSLRLPLPGEGDVLLDRDVSNSAPSSANDPAPREWSLVNEGKSGSIDFGARELLILGPLLASLVALGIWPQMISTALHFALIGLSICSIRFPRLGPLLVNVSSQFCPP